MIKISHLREDWAAFEPQNLADAAFGAGMIAAYLKVAKSPFNTSDHPREISNNFCS